MAEQRVPAQKVHRAGIVPPLHVSMINISCSVCPRLTLTQCLQPCTFKVDYTLENIPGREFGSVFLTDKNDNLALAVVSSGWSKVGEHSTIQDESWLLMLQVH
jgi:hypothetical protein